MADRLHALIREEERHCRQNFLPYMVEYGPDAFDGRRLVDESERARHYHSNHAGVYPLPVFDVTETDSTVYRVVEEGRYDLAVELRGTFTVAGRDGYADAARLLATRWAHEAAGLWEQYGAEPRHCVQPA